MNQTYLINLNTFAGFEDLSVNILPARMAVFVKKMQDLDLKVFMGQAFYTDFIQYFTNTGLLSANITTPATTAADGNYNDKVIIATSGSGENATADFIVLGGLVTSVIIDNIGDSFAIGDTFNCASLPGALFTVSALSPDVVMLPTIPQKYIDLWQGLIYVDKAGNNVNYDGMIPTLIYWAFARFVENDYIQYTKAGPVIKQHDAGISMEPKDIIKLVQQHRSVANAHCNDIELFLYNNWNNYTLFRFDQRRKSSRQSGPRIRSVDKTAYNAPGIGGNNGYPNGYNGFDWFN